MKRYLKHTAIFTSVLMLLTGCGGKKDMQGRPGGSGGSGGIPAMAQQQEKTTTAVKTQVLELSSISNEYMYSGSITPSDEVNVSGTMSGKVAKVNFDVGDKVNAGDVLFVMDTKDIENSIKVSEASVNSAQTSVNTAQNNLNMANGASMQTQLQNAKNSITNAESSLKNAQTAVDNAQLALDNAKINLEKAETEYNNNVELFEVGGISEETMNNSKDSYEQAKNQYSQSELSLQQSQNQYNSAQDSLSQAQTNYDILVNQTSKENIIKAQDSLKQSQAQLESSKTQLTNTRQNLDDAYVKSPISGVVSQCNVTAGANLSQSASPFVIINTDSVDVKVNVAEQMVNSIKAGDGVRIKVSTLSDEYMNGNISYVSPDANSDGTYEVKVNIPNGDGRLKSGMFAEVYFTKEKSDNAVVIDRDSVVTKDGESYVFVVEGDTAKKTVVEIGIDNGDTVEITSGLSQGMTIVTEGQTYLTDGDKINDVTNKKANNNSAKQETQNDMPQGNMPKRN